MAINSSDNVKFVHYQCLTIIIVIMINTISISEKIQQITLQKQKDGQKWIKQMYHSQNKLPVLCLILHKKNVFNKPQTRVKRCSRSRINQIIYRYMILKQEQCHFVEIVLKTKQNKKTTTHVNMNPKFLF